MTALTFRSRDGFELVGELEVPVEVDAALVICHAHPNMGGTMESPLLIALGEAMVSRHYAVLRFNFRGIEGSAGTPTIGLEEPADAHGAIDLMKERFPDLPIAVAGWSYGAAVAVRVAAERDDLSACVAIAPPVNEKPDVTVGLPDPHEIEFEIPVLVVVGSNDDLTPPEDSLAWAGAAGTRFEEVPAANHFFWAKYEPLMDTIAGFLEEVV